MSLTTINGYSRVTENISFIVVGGVHDFAIMSHCIFGCGCDSPVCLLRAGIVMLKLFT